VRRRDAFERRPLGIPGAVPVILDDETPRIPDVAPDRRIVCYCLCHGEESSSRVAHWLVADGYSDVSVIVGGLPRWEAEGFPVAPIDVDDRVRSIAWKALGGEGGLDVPRVLERTVLAGVELPVIREMAVVFVDMVDSTALLFRHPPEKVLSLVQEFMEPVVDTTVFHCGDVHDFEGDGALLYFGGPGEAVPAVFRMRSQLAARRERVPDLPEARFGVAVGPLIIGPIGSRFRSSLTFIGASVNLAARILKLAPPGAIAASEPVVESARTTDPELAEKFVPLPEKQQLKGFGDEPICVYLAPPEG
jgi:class 3 adenylate cyclase/rhodanese-related sulfurtransferase